MYLIGVDLSAAGEFQKKLDHEHPEKLSEERIREMLAEEIFYLMGSGIEAEAIRVIKNRFHIHFMEFESGFSIKPEQVQGMVVATFDHKLSAIGVVEGERYTKRQLTQSPISFHLYRVRAA